MDTATVEVVAHMRQRPKLHMGIDTKITKSALTSCPLLFTRSSHLCGISASWIGHGRVGGKLQAAELEALGVAYTKSLATTFVLTEWNLIGARIDNTFAGYEIMVEIVNRTSPSQSNKCVSWFDPSPAPLPRTLSPFLGRISLSERQRLSSVTSVSSNDTDGSQRRCERRKAESANRKKFLVADGDSPRHNVWSQKMLLTFDGGGVRCLSSLFILKALMKRITVYEQEMDAKSVSSADSPLIDPGSMVENDGGIGSPLAELLSDSCRYLPCHYFDYICGSSTGGLIAIMLGRLRMNIDQCLEEYTRLQGNVSRKLTTSSKLLRPRKASTWPEAEFRHLLQNDLKSPVAFRTSACENEGLFASDPERCKTICLSLQERKGTKTPYIFRTYDHLTGGVNPLDRNPGKAHDIPIFKVARATSAAPLSYKPLKLEHDMFLDASFWANNPSLEVFNEIRAMQMRSTDSIGLLMSIGSGAMASPRTDLFSRLLWPLDTSWRRPVKAVASQTENVHERMLNLTHDGSIKVYRRLNVQGSLEDIASDEWKPKESGSLTKKIIEDATTRYIKQDEVRSTLEDCAFRLVETRRARAQTPNWEGFALGVRYRCPTQDCIKAGTLYRTREDMLDHLQRIHLQPPPDPIHHREVQDILNAARVKDIYAAVLSTVSQSPNVSRRLSDPTSGGTG